MPNEVTEEEFTEIERYVVLLYCRTSDILSVNEARKYFFAHGDRQISNISPTKDALRQHVNRAAYQAGHIWGQAPTASPTVPSPGDWSWTGSKESGWSPLWIKLQEASKGCQELIRCHCKTVQVL